MNQLSFLDLVTPTKVKEGQPLNREQKLKWLSENMHRHRMGQIDREEYLQMRVASLAVRNNEAIDIPVEVDSY
jgi:hypothetical protein